MRTLNTYAGLVALGVGLIVIAFTFAILTRTPDKVLGSTSRGSEYQATTTTAGSFLPEQLLQTGGGTLGSVIITGAAAGVINIYDATTSNVSLRTNQPASSSILLATFPVSAAAGTYTFDRVFFTGLYVSVVGVMPTTTVTFRP